MSTNVHRAFSRNTFRAPILYSDCVSDAYHRAEMVNSSVGGMYFETDQSIRPGAGIHIKLVDFCPDPYWPEACGSFLAEVRWCKKRVENDATIYSIGVRFIMEACTQCGKKIEHKDISAVGLCPHCLARICSVSDEKIKACFENYMIGNVL